jgi:hypothetical protein
LNFHSNVAKDESNDRIARATFPQNGVKSWGSGSVVSAKGVNYVFSSFMMFAGMWFAAVLMVKVALAGGGVGAG